MNKVLRVDIGDSIPKVLTIQDDLKKLQGKAEVKRRRVVEHSHLPTCTCTAHSINNF